MPSWLRRAKSRMGPYSASDRDRRWPTGTAPLSAGASAEQFTASELRRLLKRGWRLINHAGLRRGDIDHLLIGPAGVVVVETKWSATPWDVDAPSSYLYSAIDQAQRSASAVRLWQPVKSAGVEHVWSTVFAWSGFAPDAPAKPASSQRHGQTQVVYGRSAAASWRTALENAPAHLTPEQVDRLWPRGRSPPFGDMPTGQVLRDFWTLANLTERAIASLAVWGSVELWPSSDTLTLRRAAASTWGRGSMSRFAWCSLHIETEP